VGAVDLLNALVGGIANNIPTLGMGSFWYVVAFLVPILWIAHVLAFLLLLRPQAATRYGLLPAERTAAAHREVGIRVGRAADPPASVGRPGQQDPGPPCKRRVA